MTANVSDWRQELAFSERLAVTTALSKAYIAANPGCTSDSAKSYAKTEENDIRLHALTLKEYHELYKKAVHLLQANTAPSEPVIDHYVGEHSFSNLPEHDAKIGTYQQAKHYKDGLFSEVFVAKDSKTDGELVALKITTPSMMTAPHNAFREARILQSLRDSSNTIRLLESFKESQDRFVLVFPFMPHDLSILLSRDLLPKSSQRKVLHDLFSALACIHSRGIIHRDVKPSNILLASPHGPAYIADFGIAWSADDQDSESADVKLLEVGTTCYRPPELLFGYQRYGSALDMWAAGCVVAQVLSCGRETLFDAGELGSELALIKSIFETLGTPDLDIWPEAADLPDWGKMNFVKYPRRAWEDILPDCDDGARSLVAELVVYQSSNRKSAELILQHPYFSDST